MPSPQNIRDKKTIALTYQFEYSCLTTFKMIVKFFNGTTG